MRRCSNYSPYRICLACQTGVPSVFCHAKWMVLRHVEYSSEEGRWMPVKKPVESSANGGGQGSVTEGMLPKKFPNLLAMLQDSKYDDGSARETSTLLVLAEGGMVKLCLNDRDLGRTAWTTATTLEDALASLESRLAKDQCEWRKSEPWQGRKKK